MGARGKGMSQGTNWRRALLAAVAATMLTIIAGTEPLHAKDDTPAVASAAATLPKPRPSPPRNLPAPLDPRVTAAPVAATMLAIAAGTEAVHAKDDTPAVVNTAATILPRPRPSQRHLAPPLDVRVTAAPIEAEAYQRRQVNCLAKAIYFEARSESVDGQFAVARVILNRTESGHYPDTICGVVYQNAHRINRCQFSFACDRLPDEPKESIAWALALGMAEALVRTEHPLLSQKLLKSTHYHADYVRPYWAPQLAMTGSIGRHIFYIEER